MCGERPHAMMRGGAPMSTARMPCSCGTRGMISARRRKCFPSHPALSSSPSLEMVSITSSPLPPPSTANANAALLGEGKKRLSCTVCTKHARENRTLLILVAGFVCFLKVVLWNGNHFQLRARVFEWVGRNDDEVFIGDSCPLCHGHGGPISA